jgi:perosamine synthetase
MNKIKLNSQGVLDDGSKFILPWTGRGIDYTDEDIAIVIDVMKNADPLTQGQYLKEFEKAFCDYHSDIPSFAISSGAGGLEISADLIEVEPGDEIIIPAHTYVATVIPFARRGAKIVWADIDMETRVLNATTIEPLITSKTKAIIPVHLYGLCVEMEEILSLCKNNNIFIIEDCAQALGSSYKNRKCGTFGDISIYSFHAQKNITTLGEGGMISTRIPELSKKIPGLRHNGHRAFEIMKDYYWKPAMVNVDFDTMGIWPHNYSIGEAQCALGLNLLKRIDDINNRRIKNARYIIDSLSDLHEITFQKTPENATNVYSNLSALYINDSKHVTRDNLIQKLSEEYKIQPVVQNHPLYRYPLMKRAGYGDANCPNTDKFFDNMLSLPFYEWYSKNQLDYLIESTRMAIKSLRK